METRRKHPACGPFLADLRRRKGFSQAKLAERAATTQTSVSRIERDLVSPSLQTLNRLLEAMGETLVVGSVPVADPPPRGGNRSIRELRADFDDSSPEERMERSGALSHALTALAISAPKK